MEKTLEQALENYDNEAKCEGCGTEIESDEYPVCDNCLDENEISGDQKFDIEEYAKKLEKEFAGEYIPELDK